MASSVYRRSPQHGDVEDTTRHGGLSNIFLLGREDRTPPLPRMGEGDEEHGVLIRRSSLRWLSPIAERLPTTLERLPTIVEWSAVSRPGAARPGESAPRRSGRPPSACCLHRAAAGARRCRYPSRSGSAGGSSIPTADSPGLARRRAAYAAANACAGRAWGWPLAGPRYMGASDCSTAHRSSP